ncbi:MAG TPA: hypothetical protein VMF69_20655 [Gemmataceae bacterium]|nr:hypothetical protein [Gemmataceae bacterium]
MSRRKQQLCRICKKKPVWRGGDVTEPGPYCKRCYHKRIWPNRPSLRKKEPQVSEMFGKGSLDPVGEEQGISEDETL